MTIRSVVLGLLGAAGLCGVVHFFDTFAGGGMLIRDFVPFSVFGTLLFYVMVINPLLRRLLLSRTELAVIVGLMLAVCCIPSYGFLRLFCNPMVMSHQEYEQRPEYRKHDIMSMVPPQMLADVSKNKDEALGGYIRGLGTPENLISFRDVPWYAWTRTLGFWVPLIFTLWMCMLGLGLVMHPQWSRNEKIAYPIVKFATALMPVGPGQRSILRSRLFWLGALTIGGIYASNLVYRLTDGAWIEIPLRFDFRPLASLFPLLERGGGVWMFGIPTYFFAVGFAYFVASDVSFSVGVGPIVFALVVGLCRIYGVDLHGAPGSGLMSVQAFLWAGAYLGMFLMLLYAGRRYYFSVLKAMFGLGRGDNTPRASVWGIRVFFVAMIAFVLQLTLVGLDWQLGLLYTVGFVMIFTVMARIVTETGVYYMHPWFFPCALLAGFMGYEALGVRSVLIMVFVTSIVMSAPRETFMPFLMNALKLVDDNLAPVGKMASWFVVAMVIGLAVAVPITIYWHYNMPVFLQPGDGTGGSTRAFDAAVAAKEYLSETGGAAAAESLSSWRRFTHARAMNLTLMPLCIGLVLVLLCSVARLRLTWWPIHPVFFAVWGTWPSAKLACSFLLGWAIKVIIVRLGGQDLYIKLKPLMVGIIVGVMFGMIMKAAMSAGCYFFLGERVGFGGMF